MEISCHRLPDYRYDAGMSTDERNNLNSEGKIRRTQMERNCAVQECERIEFFLCVYLHFGQDDISVSDCLIHHRV